MSTYFVGHYVEQLLDVGTAAMLSKQNAIVLGAPGFGKTAITRSLAQHLTGGSYSFTRIDPSTPPDAVKGPYNPAAMMETPPRLERMVDGTPYDLAVLLGIIDEIGRANEATFDALLDTLDRLDVPVAPPILATTNFMPSNERVEALIDRFALWLWLQPDQLDLGGIVAAQLNGAGRPQVDTAGLPAPDEIDDVRSAVPGQRAIDAITKLLDDLAHEAEQQGRKPHPRRITQWSHVLFRTGVWHTGSADFSTVPEKSAKLLRYMWPAITPDEQATWTQIASSVVDVLGAAIEEIMASLVDDLNAIANSSARERNTLVMAMTQKIQQRQAELEQLAGDDNPRVEEAAEQMSTWLSQVLSGQEIEL